MGLDVLQWTPFMFLILYSGLQSISQELYEAARVDGASYWQIVRRVTLPMLAPIILIAIFLRGIDAFRTFDVIYVLTGGGPGDLTTSLSVYIYKMGFVNGNTSQSAATSIIISLILLPFLPFLIRRILRQSGA